MPSFSTLHIVLAAAVAVSADLSVNNWCGQTVYIYQSNAGGCDKGENDICQGQPGAKPYTLSPGQKGATIPWIKNGQGTSVKIAKDSSFGTILQVEYTFTGPTFFWDLSNLDGAGASVTGTPFAADNVKISPSGAGTGSGTCKTIKCTAKKVCADAYQHPDDTATKSCPADTGTMTLDLCQPEAQFNARAVEFKA